MHSGSRLHVALLLTTFKTEFMISLHALWLFSSFKSTRIQIGIPCCSKQWMTHYRWRDVVQYLPATSSVWRRATFLHCYDVMEFQSEFWCSRNCSSTMRAFPGSALRVIWYFYHIADRHPRSCNISFMHFRMTRCKSTPWLSVEAEKTGATLVNGHE
jgi:hypothetical protein